MKKSGIALGLVVAMCAFGVVAAPALAFGKFRASIKGQTISEATPGFAKGHGEVEFARLGPYTIECPKIKDSGMVVSEESESFFTEILFNKCTTVSHPKGGVGVEEIKQIHFKLGMEFLSNFSAKVGEGESEVRITAPSEVSFKAGPSKCVVTIPEQTLSTHGEAGVPENEEEMEERPGAIEKYGEFRKRLDFTIDLKHLHAELTPNSHCRYEEGSEEGKFNPETGMVEWFGSVFEGNLEEITLKNGNVWFEE